MKIKLLNKEGISIPVSAHESDTGYDLIAVSEPKIVGEMISDGIYKSISYIEYDTGLQVEPRNNGLNGYIVINNFWEKCSDGYTLVYARSSISKYNLILANSVGIVDNMYRGNILIRFKYIIQPEDLSYIENTGIVCVINKDKIYKKGDKVAQIVAAWKEPIEWEVVDQLKETKRASGGFGSSGQ